MVTTKMRLKIVTGVIILIAAIFLGYIFLFKKYLSPVTQTNGLDEIGLPSASEIEPLTVEADSARIGDLVMRLSTTGLTPRIWKFSVVSNFLDLTALRPRHWL